jgi:hypothetical protein
MNHKGVSDLLHEEGGVRYAIANERFGNAIVDVLSESFSREPMSAAVGLLACDLRPLVVCNSDIGTALMYHEACVRESFA